MNKKVGHRREIKLEVRAKIDHWWNEAYINGELIFDFNGKSDDPQAEAVAFWKKLLGWIRTLRRRPFERQHLWKIMQSCTLRNPKNGVVAIIRKKESVTLLPIDMKIKRGDVLPVGTKQNKPKTILKNMRKNYQKGLHAELNQV